MSGHSKWSQIKHKKAITDARKGKLFSKMSAQISIAAKKGGDPATNANLRLMIEKARAAGITKENIDRALKRGTGELGGATLEQVRYECYGPGGTAILIDAVTDNKNRTLNDIRFVLNKFGGKLAEHGSVAYLFELQGEIAVKVDPLKKEQIELAAIDAGAVDYVATDDRAIFFTSPGNLDKAVKTIAEAGAIIESSELTMEPKQTIQTDDQAVKLLEALDELDDITQTYTNLG